jgi:hypothetical protein
MNTTSPAYCKREKLPTRIFYWEFTPCIVYRPWEMKDVEFSDNFRFSITPCVRSPVEFFSVFSRTCHQGC